MKNAKWFVLAGVALGSAFLVSSPYMAYFLYAFLLLVAIAHVSTTAWLSGLDCERSISATTLRQGDTLEVEVKIHNRRGWPIPWIFLEDLHPSDFPLAGDDSRLVVLMPGRSVTMNYTLTCPRRGYHRIGPLVMESGDLFGLQRRFRSGVNQDYISVLPTIAYIDTFNVTSKRPQGAVRIANRIYEDPSRTLGVREYVPGDPMNRIHWKATARTGKLFTRTLEPSTVSGGTLILDLHQDSYTLERAEERMELAVTVTASIAHLLHMSGEQTGLLTNAFDAAEVARYDVDAAEVLSREEVDESVAEEVMSERIRPLQVPTLRSAVQSQKIAENLARVVPGKGLTVEQLLQAEFRGLPRDAALLPVVPQVTEGFALMLAEMKLSGFAVSVFFIRDRSGYEEAAALLAPHNIHVFHIQEPRDLHELSPAKIGH